MAVPRDTEAVEPHLLLPTTDPRMSAARAIQDIPAERRTPVRLLRALKAAGLAVVWAPHPADPPDGGARWVECAQCGRSGEFVWQTQYPHIVHPPTVCALPPRVATPARYGWADVD